MEDLVVAVPAAGLIVALATIFLIRSERDAVDGLIGYLVVLYLVPARIVFPGTGAIGTPAVAVGLLLFLWWLLSKMMPRMDIATGAQPIRTALLVYFGWMLISYGFLIRRHLSEIEANGSQRAVLTALTLFGVAAVAADGIRDRERLEKLVTVLVGLAAAVGFMGLVQFFTPIDLVEYIRIPGMELTKDLSRTTSRGILNRPFSTTLHPIELGVVMAMVFPLALYRLSLAGDSPGAKARRWVPVVLIGATIPLTVSRSAMLAVIVAVGYYAISLSPRSRINVAGAAVIAVVVARLAVPGLVGTFSNLFFGSGDDPSIQTRLSDVNVVLSMLSERPLLGWGPGIMNVEEYTLLDNQYYMTAIELGVIGLMCLMLLVATGAIAGRRVARAADAATRRLSAGLVGGVLAGGVAMATFDGFSFRIFSGTLFILLGMVGALWRLTPLPPQRGGDGFSEPVGSLRPESSESSWT